MTIDTRILWLIGWMALRSAAQDNSPPANATIGGLDSGLKKELETLAEKLEGIRDLVTSFEEQKFSALLKEPLVARGQMRAFGTRSRWDRTGPKPSSMLVDAAEIRIYYPERSTLEVYRVDEKLRWLTVWALPKLPVMLERFFIERIPPAELGAFEAGANPLGLRLRPRDAAIGEYLRRVDIVFDSATALVIRVEILDADDDRTVISFSNTRPNSGLSDRDVELVVPSRTKTVRPLEKLEKEPTPARP